MNRFTVEGCGKYAMQTLVKMKLEWLYPSQTELTSEQEILQRIRGISRNDKGISFPRRENNPRCAGSKQQRFKIQESKSDPKKFNIHS